MKICIHRDCHAEGKPQKNVEFTRNARSKDGLSYYCSKCTQIQQLKLKEKSPETFNANQAASTARYDAKYPKKARMRRFVAQAKRKGILVQEPCVECGAEKTDAHHCDYNKPLEVIWLCRLHHKRWHRAHGYGKNAEGEVDAVWQEKLFV
jgi:hypothetical protein